MLSFFHTMFSISQLTTSCINDTFEYFAYIALSQHHVHHKYCSSNFLFAYSGTRQFDSCSWEYINTSQCYVLALLLSKSTHYTLSDISWTDNLYQQYMRRSTITICLIS
jgi:hypothetical protein